MGHRASALLGFALVCGVVTTAPRVAAQDVTDAMRRRIVFEVWAGMARGSPRWGVLGETPALDFAAFGLRFSRRIGDADGRMSPSRWTELHTDLVPLARMSPPYISLGPNAPQCRRGQLCVRRSTPEGSVLAVGAATGAGIAPLGITTRFRHDTRLSPSFGATGGALWFDRKVPTTAGSRFNFTAALEAGLRFGPPDQPAITLAYRFHHISNAGTARENPGLASHLIAFGIRTGSGG